MIRLVVVLVLLVSVNAPAAAMLIRGGLVYTITGPILKDADVLVKDGKIEDIGHGLTAPSGTTTIDARKKVVMPGFVVAQQVSGLGGWGTPPYGVDVFSTSLQFALSTGITSAHAGSSVIKLTYGDPKGIVLGSTAHMTFSGSLSWTNKYNLRQRLLDARTQLRAGGGGSSSSYVRLIKGEIPLRMRLSRAQDLLWATTLAREFNIRLIIEGGVESWTVAEELGRVGASVIISVRALTAPPDTPDDAPGSNVKIAAILRRAGVPFALVPPQLGVSVTGGIAGRGITSLPMEAAFAVRGGLDEPTALSAITIEPARMLGVDQRVGSLEKGKDADIILLNGDPLHWKTFVDYTIINGKVYYDRSKSDLLPAAGK